MALAAQARRSASGGHSVTLRPIALFLAPSWVAGEASKIKRGVTKRADARRHAPTRFRRGGVDGAGTQGRDVVEVRSREEILETLDSDGRLEGLPFMPQMLEYCGRRFTVIASAHKTCDVVAGEGRRLVRCVHLDVRCDGKAYGGCQAACLIFWKEDWLKRRLHGTTQRDERNEPASSASAADPELVWRGTKKDRPGLR